MGIMGLMGVEVPFVSATSAADAQLQFVENFPMRFGAGFLGLSNATLSVHHVNIPVSLSFGFPVVLLSAAGSTARTQNLSFGLYSLNGSTLSLANSASAAPNITSGISWVSFGTSATQNITPGSWYFALIAQSSGAAFGSLFCNSSINPGNAQPFFIMGRMTASTTAMPASLATSDLDVTGADAMRQPYIILTA